MAKHKGSLRGNSFSIRPATRLDFFLKDSSIAKSEYRGFAILFLLASWFYLFINPIIRYYDKNEFLDPSLAKAMFEDFFLIMALWIALAAWSFTSYYLHKLYMKRIMSRTMLYVFQHITQSMTIMYAVGHCFYYNWPIVPAAFAQMLASIYLMKMHSFTMANLDFNDTLGTKDANPYYPANVNFKNFCYYVACPALVYEPIYPRGPSIRFSYLFWKTVSMAGSMMALYLICTSYIIPIATKSPKLSFIEAYTRLLLPLLIADILVFYIIFECICNLFAEVTCFGDRDFYQDWWNSTTWDEYSRKWNRPVYEFLFRHIYLETQEKLKWSQRSATIATFLFSACLHEMIMAVCFRLVRMYLFVFMAFQIPLRALGKRFKGTVFGNVIFWICMTTGIPLLAVMYSREWADNFSNSEKMPLRLF